RLERTDHIRHVLLPRPEARGAAAAQRRARERSFLARARGHDALHHLDVGRGPLAVPLVALPRRPRRNPLQLRRRDACDGAVLHAAARRWSAVLVRHGAHGREPAAHVCRRAHRARLATRSSRRARRGAESGAYAMSFLGLHKAIERNTGLLIFGILVVASIGGLVQVLPTTLDDSLHAPAPNVVPYAPLELVGRDVYIREACSTCHSQQVRPLLAEVKRYGPYARSGEFAYDRPFLWGSKRTGPDLLREGGKYSDAWHRVHMTNPRAVVATSIMPAYPWLA